MSNPSEFPWDENNFVNPRKDANIIKFEMNDGIFQISGTVIEELPQTGGKSLITKSLDFNVNIPVKTWDEIVRRLK